MIIKKRHIYILVCILLIVGVIILKLRKNTIGEVKNKMDKRTYLEDLEIWVTTPDKKNLLTKQELKEEIKSTDTFNYKIEIDNKIVYQKMEGFGASFTDASAYLVYNKLNTINRKKLMKKLFDPDKGIGISFLRQPMGASDFTTRIYSYDDMPLGETDFELNKFNIEHDKEYIIPLLKEAIKINPRLKIMASPWSAPGWMKTTDDMIGGSLKKECYNVFANYFVKFIKAYEEEGILIYAITPQNEPLYVPTEYPGMYMGPEEQAIFIGEYLGPIFKKNNIETKILCYDHNWDNIEYTNLIFSHFNASKYTSGSAWHCYGGSHDTMSLVHDKFPEKDIFLTEASGGDWIPSFYEAFMDQMLHIIRSTRNWSKSVVWWNIALDENNGPTILSNSTCRGMVKIDQRDESVEYNVDYYTMGHISKFVVPGAYRIYSSTFIDDLETVAFENPDGSLVLILLNRTLDEKTINIICKDGSYIHKVPGSAAMTFKWNK